LDKWSFNVPVNLKENTGPKYSKFKEILKMAKRRKKDAAKKAQNTKPQKKGCKK